MNGYSGMETFSLRALAPAIGLGFFMLLLLVYLTFAPKGPPPMTLVAVFSPASRFENRWRALDAVDGRLVALGAFDNIWIIFSEMPDAPARLYGAGAYLVLDAFGLGGCATQGRTKFGFTKPSRSSTGLAKTGNAP